ncbi:hypothetical protein ASAP_1572 [Asaia bogorensis]|uniref:Uncharacterized protein n=1 Tax=Asaia bogorensis TaxID=91915 RepID=A0A060QKP5_9PROT|nr:hypothetical protein ASAP_1572 [Asaia bogorensis]
MVVVYPALCDRFTLGTQFAGFTQRQQGAHFFAAVTSAEIVRLGHALGSGPERLCGSHGKRPILRFGLGHFGDRCCDFWRYGHTQILPETAPRYNENPVRTPPKPPLHRRGYSPATKARPRTPDRHPSRAGLGLGWRGCRRGRTRWGREGVSQDIMPYAERQKKFLTSIYDDKRGRIVY